ncbi:class I SAM-dependent methyltransferase [Bacillaceae bacterium S4-13-58]
MTGHRFKPEKAEKLLDPKRTKLILPEKVIEYLDIQENDVVADLGAGNGFLTIPLAQKNKADVFAVDIEPKMLDLLKERAQTEKLNNIHYIVSDLEDIKMDSAQVNKTVIAFVMHEIPNLEKALSEFKRITKSGGRILIIDWEAIESEVGPPLHERISSAKMESFLKEKGFSTKVYKPNESVYAISCDLL